MRNIAERYQGQPLSGVLVLTDGNATDLPDGKLNAAGLPPVYPVVIGRDDPIKDISLQKVAVSQTAFEDAPVNIQADVAKGGYSGRDIVAQLLRFQTAKRCRNRPCARAGTRNCFRSGLNLSRRKPGISFYRVRVSAQDELGQFDKPETSTEATLANNSRVHRGEPRQGPLSHSVRRRPAQMGIQIHEPRAWTRTTRSNWSA